MCTKVKIMTFNLRVESSHDNINAFHNRHQRIIETIENNSPDIIGFQEATDNIRDWLRASLPDYMIIGCGRCDGYIGEGIPIAFKKNQFELIEFKSEWLSKTPDVPGSTYGTDQSKFPRMFVSAKLRYKNAKNPLTIYNIHTDHLGEKARMLEVKQLINVISQKNNEKFVITGDFNAVPNTKEIIYMTEGDKSLDIVDTTAALSGTYHGFGSKNPKVKIDYIFTNMPYSNSYIVEDKSVDGIYISDHHQVCTEIILL